MLSRLRLAFVRARAAILIMAMVYAATIAAGIIMVHAGSSAALRYRDRLVTHAHQNDPTSRADDRGEHWTAAAIDFSRNLGLGAIPETISGFTLVLPVALGGYRGWVGGIVSVDGHHRSRLQTAHSAAYYLTTMMLQVGGFILAGAAGLHLGWANLRRRGPFVGPAWFRIPEPALLDAAWLYAAIIPIFAAGSLFEFLAQ